MRRVEDIGSVVGHAGVTVDDGIGAEQEDLWDDRGLAQSANRRPASLHLPGWHRAQAQLGRRGPQRVNSDGDREILGM